MVPLLSWTLLSLCYSVAAQELVCARDFCAKNPCTPLDCDKGGHRLVKNATDCGCCHTCVRFLGEGEPCEDHLLATVPRVECGPGLQCGEDLKCRPADTECVRKQLEYDRSDAHFEGGRPRPQCDTFGEFQPVQCKPEMLCYCSARDGTRIFGTARYSSDGNMDCGCSRDYAELARKPEEKEDFLLCQENGNYDSLQCTDSSCFCVDSSGQLDGQPVSREGSIRSLKCYDSPVHGGDYSAPCWRARRNITQQIVALKEEGLEGVVGVELPQCDLDGSYAPVQCSGSKCFCVKKDGERYHPEKAVDRYSEDAKKMNCRCLRELANEYTCDPSTGDYERIQCSIPFCFCVDSEGFQCSEEVLWSDKESLPCVNDNYAPCRVQ